MKMKKNKIFKKIYKIKNFKKKLNFYMIFFADLDNKLGQEYLALIGSNKGSQHSPIIIWTSLPKQ